MEESYPLIEEEREELRSSCAHTDSGPGCPMYFGVRSYLHHFYDRSPSPQHRTNFCDKCRDNEVHAEHSWLTARFLTKALLWLAINLVLIGAILLMLGFLLPQRHVVVGFQNNLELIDRSALRYNEILQRCQVAGFSVLGAGAVLLIFALVLLASQAGPREDEATLCRLNNIAEEPGDKIPADEKLSRIQPEWEISQVY